jgi:hypothetical protein
MTLREIAVPLGALTLGIDQSGVSQIRASAVRHLRSALADLAHAKPNLAGILDPYVASAPQRRNEPHCSASPA